MQSIAAFALVVFLLQSLFQAFPAKAEAVLRVVSLGDSFTAGNGAGSYYGPTGCYRSRNNYAEQAIRLAGIKAEYKNFACSNAVSADIAAQINAAKLDVRAADLILLTIGGNDADFAKVVVECVVAEAMYAPSCVQRLEESWSNLDNLVAQVKSAVAKVSAAAPNARIVLVGYPYLMEDCSYKVAIKNSRGLFQYDVSHQLRTLQAWYDGRVESAVKSTGKSNVRFVSVLKDFKSHMYCGSGEKWFVDLLGSSVVAEYFHPNQKGHTAIARKLISSSVFKFERPVLAKPAPAKPRPAVKQPAQGKLVGYSKMPFECGVAVYATTYDSFPYQGRVFYHAHALDFPIALNTKVVSPVDGVVRVGWDPAGFGRFIDVRSGSYTHRLAHLQKQVAVRNGQRVARGAVLGRVGVTGATTGPHLHYEVLLNGRHASIDLGGARLRWSKPFSVHGDRRTLDKLVSANCGKGGSKSAASQQGFFAGDEVKLNISSRSRLIAMDGKGRHKDIFPGISVPLYRVECDRNNDGRDEVYSVEYRNKRYYIMQAKLAGNGRPAWSEFYRGSAKITGLSCGNYWEGRADELKMHLANGEIREVLGPNKTRRIYHGIQSPSFRVECDTNADGRDEIYSLEKTSRGYRLMQAYASHGSRIWQHYMPEARLNGRKVRAMSCGDSNGDKRDELKFYFMDSRNIEFINPLSSFANRRFQIAFRHITPAKFMVECDMDRNGRDEIYYIENRGSDFMMRGDMSRRAWQHVRRFVSQVKALSCGNMDGR